MNDIEAAQAELARHLADAEFRVDFGNRVRILPESSTKLALAISLCIAAHHNRLGKLIAKELAQPPETK